MWTDTDNKWRTTLALAHSCARYTSNEPMIDEITPISL